MSFSIFQNCLYWYLFTTIVDILDEWILWIFVQCEVNHDKLDTMLERSQYLAASVLMQPVILGNNIVQCPLEDSGLVSAVFWLMRQLHRRFLNNVMEHPYVYKNVK